MGRMSRFLRFCAFLSVLFFTTNVFAAGYSCPTYKKYTSCNAGYYMTNSSGTYNGTPAVGNSCTICPAGSYCTGGTANKVACARGSYTNATGKSACTACSAGTTTSGTGQTSCNATCTNNNSYDNSWATPSWSANTVTNLCKISNCKAGSKYSSTAYTYYTGTCSACGSGTYMASSAHTNTSCTSCTTTSGWTTTTSSTGSTAYTACYQTQTPANCASGTIKRTASSISGTTITYGTASVTSALSSSPGYYVNGTSCTVCANGKFYGGGTATSCTSCPSLTSGYSYVSGTGWTSYSSCKEQMRPTNCYSGYLTKTATSATAWGTATNNITAKAGYKVAGSGDSATCSACGYGSYSANGATSCTACPTADSGWTAYSTSNVSTTYSACYEYKSGTNISSYCSAGQLRRAASSASAYSTTVTISTALQAKAGAYVNGQTCTQCSGAVFSAGGTATSCTACPAQTDGWTRATGTGWDSYTDCYQTKAATAVSTYCYSGQLKQIGASATTWATATVSTAFTADKGSYVTGSGANTTCSQCAAGTYQGTDGSTATSCSACTGRTKYSAKGAAACSDVGTGYYTTGCNTSGNNCTGRTQCSGSTYCVSGVQNNCPSAETDWTLGTGTGWSAVTSCFETRAATNVSSYCSAGQLKKNATSSATWPTSATISTAFQAKAGAYVNGQTCTQCAAGTYQGTDGSTATSCSACTGRTKYSAKGAAACSDVGTGYYTTGCNTSGNNCTGRTQCSGSTYCVSGVQNNCPSAETDWTLGTGTGWSAVTSCFETRAATNVSSYCSAGQLKKNATSSATWPTSATISTAFQAKAGAYVNGQTCTQCAAGKYSAGGTATSCTNVKAGCYADAAGSSDECPKTCPGLYVNSAAGSDSINDCYFTTTGGYYISASDATSQTKCEAKYYCPATTLYYPNTGSKQSCPDPTSSTYKETLAEMDWLTERCPTATTSNSSLTASNYQTWSNTGLSAITQCPATMTVSTPCANFSIESAKYNSTTGHYNSDVGSVYTGNVKAGYYLQTIYSSTYCNTSTNRMLYRKAVVCPAGSYCPGGTVPSCSSGDYNDTWGANLCTSLGSFYTTSSAGATAATSCSGKTTAGNYIATVNAGQVTCAAGGYCPGDVTVAYGSTGGRTACGAGKYNASTGSSSSSACANITAGCYGTSATTACPAVCAANKWSAAGASSCSDCPTDYENSGDTATSHANQSSCKITVDGGYYIGTAGDNSSNWDKCSAGYYKAAHSVAYGSTSSCSACGAVNKYSSSGASACSTVSTGYYTTGGTTTTRTGQSQCTSGTYCSGGEQKTCPSGYGASAAGSDAAADCYMSVAATKYVKAANDANATACGTGTYKAAHTVYYGGTSTCNSCPSGYDDGAAVATQAECVISVAGGKYVGTANSATLTDCAAGTYKATHTVAYGSTSSCGQCPANSYCPAGASAATACSTLASGFYPNSAAGSDAATDCKTDSLSGKYVASKNATSATNCAGGTYKAAHQVAYGSTSSCGQCPANSYCPAGASAATACSTLASGFYPNSAAGSDAAADCYTNSLSGKYVASANATSATSCAGGTYKAAHQVAYGSTSSCGQCPANSYCPAGASAATACSTLASGFYPNSAAGSDAATDCKTDSLSGKYVASKNATSATNCSCGTYKAAHTVAYGSTSSCATTSAGYYAAAGAATQTKASAGYYAAAGACDQTKIQAGCFGGEGSVSACPNSCPAAESGWTLASTTGLKVVTDCAEITTPSTSGSPIATICTAGTLTKKATNATTWGSATASGLTAKAGRYVNGTTCSACAAGTYTSSATTATSCTPAATGYYVSGTEATSQTACPAGTYQGSTGKTSCSDAVAGTYTTGCKDTTNNKACTGTSVCSNGTYSDQKASSCTACTTAKGYTNSGTTASSHAGAASCKVTCGAGQYVASAGAGCVNVGVDTTTNTGYWGAGGTVSQTATLARNKCDTGLITTGSGTGANEAADCGRKLHAGDNVIYLRSESRTTPALRVKIGDKTFFGALSTALSGALKVKNGSTEYSVVNDWQ